MSYGIIIRRADGTIIAAPGVQGGGIFIGVRTISAGVSDTWTFNTVPGGSYLRVLQVSGGAHYYTIGTNGSNQATLTATARTTYTISGNQFGFQDSTFLIFSTFTTEDLSNDYGIAVINDSGERLVSAIHSSPVFTAKVSSWNLGLNYSIAEEGYTVYEYSSSPLSYGLGQDNLVFWNIPSSNADTWYRPFYNYFNSPSSYTLGLQVISSSASYTLPEAFIFQLSGITQSADTYGIRIRNAAGAVTYDSGLSHMVISNISNNLNYPLFTDPYDSNAGVVTDSIPLCFIPSFFQEKFTYVGSLSTNRKEYFGTVRRNGSNIDTRTFLFSDYNEDFGINPGQELNFTYGMETGLYIVSLPGSYYGANSLSGVPTPTPTPAAPSTIFTVPAGSTSVSEGSSILFTVRATGVALNTVRYWALASTTGATLADIQGGVVTGSVTLNVNNTTNVEGSFSVTIATDAEQPETGESFFAKIYATSGDRDADTNILATSPVVSITNTTPAPTPTVPTPTVPTPTPTTPSPAVPSPTPTTPSPAVPSPTPTTPSPAAPSPTPTTPSPTPTVPTLSASITPTQNGGVGPFFVNETTNNSITFDYTITNRGGQTVYWGVSGGANNDGSDYTGSIYGSISSDTGSFTVTIAADSVTEGSETFTIHMWASGPYTPPTFYEWPDIVTIGDTSQSPAPTPTVPTPTPVVPTPTPTVPTPTPVVPTPTLTAVWYIAGISSTDINEGGSPTVTVSSDQVSGTFYVTTSARSFTTNLAGDSGTTIYDGNAGEYLRTFTINFPQDGVYIGDTTLDIEIRTGSASGPIVATQSIIVRETTSAPTPSVPTPTVPTPTPTVPTPTPVVPTPTPTEPTPTVPTPTVPTPTPAEPTPTVPTPTPTVPTPTPTVPTPTPVVPTPTPVVPTPTPVVPTPTLTAVWYIAGISSTDINEGGSPTVTVSSDQVSGTFYVTTSARSFTTNLAGNSGTTIYDGNSGEYLRTFTINFPQDGVYIGDTTLDIEIRTGSSSGPIVATQSIIVRETTSAPTPTVPTPTPVEPTPTVPTPTPVEPTPTVPTPTPVVPTPTPVVPTPTVPTPTPTVPTPTPTVPTPTVPTPTVPTPTVPTPTVPTPTVPTPTPVEPTPTVPTPTPVVPTPTVPTPTPVVPTPTPSYDEQVAAIGDVDLFENGVWRICVQPGAGAVYVQVTGGAPGTRLDLSGSFGPGYDFLDGSGSWTSNDIGPFFGVGTTASVTFTFQATGNVRTIDFVGVNCNI